MKRMLPLVIHEARHAGLACDVRDNWDGALADECDGHGVGVHAVARAAGGAETRGSTSAVMLSSAAATQEDEWLASSASTNMI